MKSTLRILGVSGSLRKASCNSGLIRAAARLSEDLGYEFQIADIDLPLYNGDVEAQGFPPSVLRWREQIAQADALLIASPEYNYSMTGVLKNAIDWASRPSENPPSQPLAGKPVALMGAGGGLGAARSQYHLRQVAVYVDVYIMNKPELMVKIFEQPKKFDDHGELIHEETRGRIKDLLISLNTWTRRIKL